MTFDEAVAADTLGLLLPEELPAIATEALAAGVESSSLAALAGESPRAALPYQLHELFDQALRELNVARPEPVRAAELLREYYARRVVSGDISPRLGAQAIVQGVFERVADHLPSDGFLGEAFGIAPLVGLFLDYDLVEQGYATSDEIDAGVVEECRRILALPSA